jgi:hypothetical protein
MSSLPPPDQPPLDDIHSWSTTDSAQNHHHYHQPPQPPPQRHQPHHHPPNSITITPHDVLSGRGINIAKHPGNERFRALITTHHDEDYCASYHTSEKRAIALDVLSHIRSLDPPGRFLRRPGRSKQHQYSGIPEQGPWEEMTETEAIKKTCQALRDCNRQDRTGYAAQVAMPRDVQERVSAQAQLGLSLLERARRAAAVANENPEHSSTSTATHAYAVPPKRRRDESGDVSTASAAYANLSPVSLSRTTFDDSQPIEWKRSRMESSPQQAHTRNPVITPGTATATSVASGSNLAAVGGTTSGLSFGDFHFSSSYEDEDCDPLQHIAAQAAAGMPDSPLDHHHHHDDDEDLDHPF